MADVKKLIENGKEIIENGKEVIEERKEMIEDLFEFTEEYIKTNVQLFKLRAIDKSADIISSLASNVILLTLAVFFLMMINIGVALWLGLLWGQTYYGFLVLAGFYALLTLLIYMLRNGMIKKPISDSIISQMLK